MFKTKQRSVTAVHSTNNADAPSPRSSERWT